MPDSLPVVPGAKVVRVLERAGFTVGMDADQFRKLL